MVCKTISYISHDHQTIGIMGCNPIWLMPIHILYIDIALLWPHFPKFNLLLKFGYDYNRI